MHSKQYFDILHVFIFFLSIVYTIPITMINNNRYDCPDLFFGLIMFVNSGLFCGVDYICNHYHYSDSIFSIFINGCILGLRVSGYDSITLSSGSICNTMAILTVCAESILILSVFIFAFLRIRELIILRGYQPIPQIV
jgi:hypothetical protein